MYIIMHFVVDRHGQTNTLMGRSKQFESSFSPNLMDFLYLWVVQDWDLAMFVLMTMATEPRLRNPCACMHGVINSTVDQGTDLPSNRHFTGGTSCLCWLSIWVRMLNDARLQSCFISTTHLVKIEYSLMHSYRDTNSGHRSSVPDESFLCFWRTKMLAWR